jgi:hypothetical protein
MTLLSRDHNTKLQIPQYRQAKTDHFKLPAFGRKLAGFSLLVSSAWLLCPVGSSKVKLRRCDGKACVCESLVCRDAHQGPMFPV